ncbi:MAG: hypothetical protein E4G98_06440 [Promethearchaeota archaeon]|nr:MAG: hypothetical protein E4G98_06440 [Candidatus Lokiarchaeota archaeon]
MHRKPITTSGKILLMGFLALILFIQIPHNVSAGYVDPGGTYYYTPSIRTRPVDAFSRSANTTFSVTWTAYVTGVNTLTTSRLYVNTGSGYGIVSTKGYWADYAPITYSINAPILPPNQTVTYTYKFMVYNHLKYAIDYFTVTYNSTT